MRFIVVPTGDRFMVQDTVDPDGNVYRISTEERAEKIAARLNQWMPAVQ